MRLFLCLVLMAGLIHSNPAAAELLVLTEEWAPYNYTQDGKITGSSTRIVEMTLARAGIDYEIRVGIWSGIIEKARSQPDVLIYSIGRNAERERYFHWIGPIISLHPKLYSLAGRDDIKLSKLEDVRGYRLGLHKGSYMHDYFDAHGLSGYEVVDRFDLNLRKLLAGRVDLIPGEEGTLEHLLARDGIPAASISPRFDLNQSYEFYMALNRKSSPELVGRIQRAFNELQRSGAFESNRSKLE